MTGLHLPKLDSDIPPVEIGRPPPWDGSHLGAFTEGIITHRWSIGAFLYYRLLSNQFLFSAIVMRRDKNCEMILADELKAAFGLPKLGTHGIKISSQEYTLIKPNTKDGKFMKEETLSSFREKANDRVFRVMVQEALAFRLLVQPFANYEDQVLVRPWGYSYQVISFREKRLCHRDSSLPLSVEERWFGEAKDALGNEIFPSSLSQVVRRMLFILKGGDPATKLLNIRSKIEAVITRLDESKIWLAQVIIARVYQSLDLS